MGSQRKITDMAIYATDFDGTLCTTNYPGIGEQKLIHKIIMWKLKKLKAQGHSIHLYTLRENIPHKSDNYLEHALVWCAERGLEFDCVNENSDEMTKKWGFSRKMAYTRYIDDLNVGIIGWLLRKASN